MATVKKERTVINKLTKNILSIYKIPLHYYYIPQDSKNCSCATHSRKPATEENKHQQQTIQTIIS
jgi:hypothetical protein